MSGKVCTKKDCRNRGKKQPIENFYKQFNGIGGYHSWCKECICTSRKETHKFKESDFYKMFIG